MKRITLLMAAVLLVLGLAGGPALAAGDPPVRHEPGGPAHSHHVHTGDGGCVDIAAVLFMPAANGLHRGSNASSYNAAGDDPARGPYHGTCDDRVFPGGPLVSDLGIPPHH